MSKVVSDLAMGFQWRFLRPQYWATWFFLGLLWLVTNLPRPVTVWFGRQVGLLYWRINKKRRAIAAVNLALCFPEKSEQEREHLLREHFARYGQSAVDLGVLWWGSDKKLDRLISIQGREAFLARVQNHRVVMILPHMLSLDMGTVYTSSMWPSLCMMKQANNEVINWLLWKGRTRFKPNRVIMRDQGFRPMIKAIRDHFICFYLADEDFGVGKHTEFVPFFGHQRSTLNTLSRMAKSTDAVVMAIFPRLLANGQYQVELTEPLANFPSGDERADAKRMMQVIEDGIRKDPVQYLWTMRWFKTRPDGEASPYP